MTIAQVNQEILKFLDKKEIIKLSNGKVDFTKNKELQGIFNVKTSSTIDFSKNTQALDYLSNIITLIKEVCFNLSILNGTVRVGITIGGQINESTGNLERCTFSVERTKPSQYKNQAIFECIGTLCGFLNRTPDFNSDIIWGLKQIGWHEEDKNIQYLAPTIIRCYYICPECKKEIDIELDFDELQSKEIENLYPYESNRKE